MAVMPAWASAVSDFSVWFRTRSRASWASFKDSIRSAGSIGQGVIEHPPAVGRFPLPAEKLAGPAADARRQVGEDVDQAGLGDGVRRLKQTVPSSPDGHAVGQLLVGIGELRGRPLKLSDPAHACHRPARSLPISDR